MTPFIQRRSFLKGAITMAAAGAAGHLTRAVAGAASNSGAQSPAAGVPEFAYVGCFTSMERKGHGKGIGVYRIDAASREWMQVQLVEAFNPSFLVLDRQRRFLYATHGDATYVTAFSRDSRTGQLTKLNQQATGGKNAVHLSVDPGNRFLLAANFTSGNLTVFPIGRDGALETACQQLALQGELGPHRTDQAGSHPHDIPFDPSGRFVVVPDLGFDRVFVFRFDPAAGRLIAANPASVATRAGAGPRHVDFHPTKPYLYVINQIDSTITTYAYNPSRGLLRPVQIVPTLPATFTGNSNCAEILVCPSGRFVYGSNRGMDSISIFAVDQDNGTLAPAGWQPTQGATPRFICMVPGGDYLYAANQDADSIVEFRAGQTNGKLAPTGQVVKTGSPTCVVFV